MSVPRRRSIRREVPAEPSSKSTISRTTFGRAHLLPGEDEKAYNALLAEVSTALNPVDAIDNILVSDIVYHTWQIFRLRLASSSLTESSIPDVLEELLEPLIHQRKYEDEYEMPPSPVDKLVARWIVGNRQAIERVTRLLASRKYSMTTVVSEAFVANIDTNERIDRMIATLEIRRLAALREFDRRRVTLTDQKNELSLKTKEAEFEAVELKPKRTNAKKAA
jgi:hypothetical protein